MWLCAHPPQKWVAGHVTTVTTVIGSGELTERNAPQKEGEMIQNGIENLDGALMEHE